MATKKRKTMVFTGVSETTWNEFKAECARAGVPMTTVVEAFMNAVVEGKLKPDPKTGLIFSGTDNDE